MPCSATTSRPSPTASRRSPRAGARRAKRGADTWDSLGYIHHHLGDYQQAIRCYERSLILCRELADRYNEAGTLDHIGDAHCHLGNLNAARLAWQQAIRIFDELDHPDSDHVRAKLRDHGGQADPGQRHPERRRPRRATAVRLDASAPAESRGAQPARRLSFSSAASPLPPRLALCQPLRPANAAVAAR